MDHEKLREVLNDIVDKLGELSERSNEHHKMINKIVTTLNDIHNNGEVSDEKH